MRRYPSLARWIPPALDEWGRRLRGRGTHYRGDFPTWSSALARATGYDAENILRHVRAAALQVKAGTAAYERDSVLFDRIEHSFPVLAGLLRAAVESEARLAVLDLGGALGSSYYQCRRFLSVVSSLSWGVVEQSHFVRCGKEELQDETLQFFSSLAECVATISPNVVLLSSVLQYLPTPAEVLKEIQGSTIRNVIIDRTPFSELDGDHITIQHVPEEIYSASYPCWIFSRPNFVQRFLPGYELLADFESSDGRGHAGRIDFRFGGMILRNTCFGH